MANELKLKEILQKENLSPSRLRRGDQKSGYYDYELWLEEGEETLAHALVISINKEKGLCAKLQNNSHHPPYSR